MHEPEKWGLIRFTPFENLENDSIYYYDYPVDLLYEQAVYALFRRIKWGDLNYLCQEKVDSKINLDIFISEKRANATGFFEKTNFGFEAGIKGEDGLWYLINEMGEFICTSIAKPTNE